MDQLAAVLAFRRRAWRQPPTARRRLRMPLRAREPPSRRARGAGRRAPDYRHHAATGADRGRAPLSGLQLMHPRGVRSRRASACRRAGDQQGKLGLTTPVLFGRLHVLPIATEFLGRFLASRRACSCSIAWSICSRKVSISASASGSPGLLHVGDQGRRGSLRPLREPVLSCRAGNTGDAEGARR